MANLWEENKRPNDGKTLFEQIDYFGKLSAQLEWMRQTGNGLRVAYTASGRPTAAILPDPVAIVDTNLYWIPCDSIGEAKYLIAVINSDALYAAVHGLMSVGQFGARHLHKHLWRLPIPRFDPSNRLLREISAAGDTAAAEAKCKLSELRRSHEKVTYKIGRREVRKWLVGAPEGRNVETLVEKLFD